jgi:archaellin
MNSLHLRKKALISLETLIILIAVIVIAALAAGVIIRQSGLLSQRAVTVSDQSRERLVTGIEVIGVSGQANISAEKLNDIELLVRLKAGSLPIQMKNLKILFTTQSVAMSASLQHNTATDKYSDIDISSADGTWSTFADIENNVLEATAASRLEQIRINATTHNLEINLSYASNNPDPDDELAQAGVIATIPIDDLSDASGTPVTLAVTDAPIVINGVKFGFVSITGTTSTNNSLAGTTAIISNFPSTDVCSFDNLIQEKRFCYLSKIGNGDTTLETGEMVSLRFRLKPFNLLPIETIYELQLLPKEGAIETISAVSPSTLVVQNSKLWG